MIPTPPGATVQQLFKEHRFHHLLVVDDRTLVGIISDRDLLKAISPNIGTMSETDRDRATLNKRAHQVMTSDPISVRPTTPFAAATLMLEKKVSWPARHLGRASPGRHPELARPPQSSGRCASARPITFPLRGPLGTKRLNVT